MRPSVRRAVVMGVAGAWLVGGVLAGAGIPAASADSTTDQKKALDQKIAQLRDEMEGTSQQFTEAAVSLKRSEVGLVDVRVRLAAAQAALAKAQAHDAAVASQLAFARAEEAKAVDDLAAQREQERQIRAQLGLLARVTYVSAGDSGLNGLSVALRANSPDQFAERLILAGAALQSRNGAIGRLAVEQSDMRNRQAKLSAIRARVTGLKEESAAAVAATRVAQDAAASQESQQTRLVAQQTAALNVIKARSAAERANLDQMVAEQRKLSATLAARARAAAAARGGSSAASAPPPSSNQILAYPVSGPITSGFGMRFHPILHIYRMHTGIDFGVGCGTPVYAAAAGTVISAGWAGGYGNRVVIDHGWVAGVDLATSYNHLTSIVVHSGAVHRGQLIAYSGTTGLSTGCHLHFETLANGSYVNPMRYL